MARKMTVEHMRARVKDMVDPGPTAVTYASPGWEEQAKARHAYVSRTQELQKYDSPQIVAEMCRRLLAGDTKLMGVEMLVLAIEQHGKGLE